MEDHGRDRPQAPWLNLEQIGLGWGYSRTAQECLQGVFQLHAHQFHFHSV